ncbi:MAG: restriction endonuclease subunit S [Elusimicrobiota bacterium]
MKISQVVKINARSLQRDYPFREIEYIDISSVGTGTLNEPPTKLSLSKAPSRARRLVQSGDTIISTVRPNRRSFFYLKDPKENTVVSTGFAVLSPTQQVDSRYLYYWISRPEFSDYLSAHAKGAAYPAVSPDDIGGAEIPLPSLPVQRRIASILSAYDDLIENNLRRIKILEEMARSLYREWFVEFKFPGHEKVTHVASAIGPIPKGWEVKPLEALMISQIGGGWGKEVAEEDHSEVAWVIRGTDIPDARRCFLSDLPHRYHTVSNLRSRRLEAGDIIFEVSGGSKGQPVGRSLLISAQHLSALDPDPVICASFCKRVEANQKDYGAELLYLSFLEGYESGEIEQFQVQSTGISNFKWTEYIKQTQRAVAPEPLRLRFQQLAAPIFTEIATLGLQAGNLNRTRDLLLPRLLSGETPIATAALSVKNTEGISI